MSLSDLILLQSRADSEGELLGEAANWLRNQAGCDSVDILLLADTQTITLKASTATPEQVELIQFSPQIGLTGHVLRSGKVECRHFGEAHPEEIRYPGFEVDTFGTAVFSPLRADGQAIGVAVMRWIDRTESVDLDQVSACTNDLALIIAGWKRAYMLGMNYDRLDAVSQVTETITSSPYLEEILQLLVNVTAEQFNYKVCTVRLLDEELDELVLRATQAKSTEYQRKRSIRVGESIAGKAVVEKHTIVVADVQTEEDYIGHDLAAEQGLRSMICVPLSVQDKAIGVLTCYTDAPHVFEEGEITSLETIAMQAAFAIERAKLQVRHTLMQEMHHRVKNNLQQVVSLLRLQLRHKHYPTIEDAISDSVNRILAIAAVHDLLSRDDLDRVGLLTIAKNLVGHLQQSMIGPENLVDFEVRGEDVRLTMTQATQIALVLNELLQNALEHGANGLEMKIHVTFESSGDTVTLWVANSGNSLPEGFDIQTNAHLGLQIVTNLARGLGGMFTLKDSHGWAVAEVRFTRQTND